jgi:hypothetical protein
MNIGRHQMDFGRRQMNIGRRQLIMGFHLFGFRRKNIILRRNMVFLSKNNGK